jgi:ubiquinone biosynthesis protein UbiJ
MGIFDRTALTDTEVPAARALFDRIVAAEAETLTEEQRANPREYLLDAWHKAAEAVMRPIQTRAQLESELERLQDRLSNVGELDDRVPF